MASGRVIFGPATPDLKEILRDGDNACLVAPDDEERALGGLSRLIDDASFRERLAAKALDDVSKMTWTARGRRIVTFLENRLNAIR